MLKVLVYSFLLILGLVASQFISGSSAVHLPVRILTMVALSYIMIHVGYEFELDKSAPKQYVWDYVVAATAAGFPWLFCALYFVFVLAPPQVWAHPDLWREALLEARFASPTSAGVLFSMLAVAGLAATWVFQKARILAIFDDLDTILLMIPLQIMMVGMKWQLLGIAVVIAALLVIGWKYLHSIRLGIRWPYVLVYALLITAVAETVYILSSFVDPTVPVHLEVLLPAFVLGCILARPERADPHRNDAIEGTEEGPEDIVEQQASTIVSACFMVLVGLSMPAVLPSGPAMANESLILPSSAHTLDALSYDGVPAEVLAEKNAAMGAGTMAFHVLLVTLLANVGKMFPALCYRKEASFRERLALSIAMFPRGEVGAGVLVISIGYGLGGPALTVAVLSLALNLLCTGFFIIAVKRLLARSV